MARTAKRPSKKAPGQPLIFRSAEAVGTWVARNPALVGGTTAFLLAMSFVTANAIWRQPHAHASPFFETRTDVAFTSAVAAASQPETTTIRLDRSEVPLPTVRQVPARVSDPSTRRVQTILKQLGYYKGDVDGLPGPNTSAAISAYQTRMGLTVSGRIDKQLLNELGASDITGSIEPAAAAPPAPVTDEIPLTRIQEGLRAFGNETVQVDGLMGRRTREALKLFQATFDLEQDGKPSQAVYLKMLEEGLLQ